MIKGDNEGVSRLAYVIVLLALFAAACRSDREQPLKVIVGGVLFDGTGAKPVYDSVIVIAGKRIRNVGTRAMTPIPQDSERIDASGKLISPADGSSRIAAGEPANLVIRRSTGIERVLREGQWVDFGKAADR